MQRYRLIGRQNNYFKLLLSYITLCQSSTHQIDPLQSVEFYEGKNNHAYHTKYLQFKKVIDKSKEN